MRKLALALLLSLFLSPVAQGSDTSPEPPRTLVIGLIDFPPLSHYDEAGHADGLLIPLMQRIAERAGYLPEFRVLPLARLVQAMREGTVKVWPGVPGKLGLESHTLVGTQPLGQLNVNLYHRPDTPSPRWPEDLRGQDLILLTGYEYGPTLAQQFESEANYLRVHRTHNHSAAIGMLLHRRANYLLNYQAPMNEALSSRPDVQLEHLHLARTPILMVVSDVGRPAGSVLLEELEQAYRELKERGELAPLSDF